MLKAGEILAAKRKEKNLSLLEAEEATKIRAKFLSALEAGDYKKLPNLTIARGFLKNYAEYLGLEQKSVLAVFRRETEEAKRLPLPKGMAETPQRRFLKTAVNNLHLSARSYHRLLKISRTIADLAGAERIESAHLAEALQYRPKEENFSFTV